MPCRQALATTFYDGAEATLVPVDLRLDQGRFVETRSSTTPQGSKSREPEHEVLGLIRQAELPTLPDPEGRVP